MSQTPQGQEVSPDYMKTTVGGSQVEIAALSDVGCVRSQNEDYTCVRAPEDPALVGDRGILCLVADGMGGHQAGEVASRTAVQQVADLYYADDSPDVGTRLVRAFRAANRSIHEEAQGDLAKTGMGTTMVAAAILGEKVHVANVGDSRAYLIDRGAISQITRDHSWVGEQIRAGLLSAEQARSHPHRNLVTRALGSRPTVEVDLFEGSLRDGERLLLCSDGLTTHVDDPEIRQIALRHPPQEAAQVLVERAKQAGGHDNISVLVVAVQRTGGRRSRFAQSRLPSQGAGETLPAGSFPARGRRRSVRLLATAGALLILLGLLALKVPWLLGQLGLVP